MSVVQCKPLIELVSSHRAGRYPGGGNLALLLTGKQLAEHPVLRDQMYRMRHQYFFEKLGWEVNSVNGMEFDQFDRDDTVYIFYLEADQIIGCFRILPTTKPYMLSEIFSDLAGGYIPSASHICEVSRYVVEKELIRSNAHWVHVAAHLLCALCEYFEAEGIRELIVVIHPKLFDKNGMLYGCPHKVFPPKKIGKDLAQVCHFRPPLTHQHRQASEWAGISTPVLASTELEGFYAARRVIEQGECAG